LADYAFTPEEPSTAAPANPLVFGVIGGLVATIVLLLLIRKVVSMYRSKQIIESEIYAEPEQEETGKPKKKNDGAPASGILPSKSVRALELRTNSIV
jgi:hypothetical protein